MRYPRLICTVLTALLAAFSCMNASAQFKEQAFSQQYNDDPAADKDSTDVLFYHASLVARQTGLAKKGDTVVITGGITNGASGNSNLIKVETMTR